MTVTGLNQLRSLDSLGSYPFQSLYTLPRSLMKSLVVIFLFFHFLTYSSNHLADAKPLQIVNSTTYIKDDMNIFRLPYDNKWKLNEVRYVLNHSLKFLPNNTSIAFLNKCFSIMAYKFRLIAAKPFDACGTIKNAEELVGSIAVTDKCNEKSRFSTNRKQSVAYRQKKHKT